MQLFSMWSAQRRIRPSAGQPTFAYLACRGYLIQIYTVAGIIEGRGLVRDGAGMVAAYVARGKGKKPRDSLLFSLLSTCRAFILFVYIMRTLEAIYRLLSSLIR